MLSDIAWAANKVTSILSTVVQEKNHRLQVAIYITLCPHMHLFPINLQRLRLLANWRVFATLSLLAGAPLLLRDSIHDGRDMPTATIPGTLIYGHIRA